MLITNHKFLAKYPIDRTATKLLLGTIHPHFHEHFEMQFFYGNELTLWKIFQKAFPDDLKHPGNVNCVLSFLKNKKLAVSDTILQCERINPTALDKDLKIKKYNDFDLLETIENSNIQEILCTSGFGKNNAFKIFYNEILKLPLSKKIRDSREATIEFKNSKKQVKIKALYSPSRRANMGIGGSKGYKAVKNQMTVDQYRINLYKAAISE